MESKQASEKKNGDLMDRIFQPSWFDRISAWMDGLPFPNWVGYALISAALFLIGLAAYLLGGGGEFWNTDPIFFVAVSQVGFVLYLLQYLDRFAAKALEDYIPALKPQYQTRLADIRRLLTTLPARQTMLACLGFMLIGLVMVVGVILMGGEEFGTTIDVEMGPFGYFFALLMLLMWFTNGLLFYHTFHQLRFIDFIFTDLTVVHPFHQRELYAFSGFSARTGITLLLLTPLWIIFDQGPLSLMICLVFAGFGLIAFFTPLVGVHRLLVKEKDRLLDENGRQVEQAIKALPDKLSTASPEEIAVLEKSLSSLERARGQIEGISTWPWRAETFRQLMAAVLLPTLIWLIQYLLLEYVLG